MGNIFTVQTGQNFLQSVIDKISILPSMSDAVIYVPTRRLGKALQSEILRHSDGVPTLMPVIKIFIKSCYKSIGQKIIINFR